VEDAALLLVASVRRDGYLKPRIVARLTLDNGQTQSFEWTEAGREPLPRPLRVRKLRF